MALINSFAASQIIGLPGVIVLTDTSQGQDTNITERRVFIVDANNDYLVPDGTITNYVVWPYADISIQINCLKVDKAPNITVEWIGTVPVSPYIFDYTFDYTFN